MKLNEKISEAIREHLPESLAGELKTYLADFDRVKKEAAEYKAILAAEQKTLELERAKTSELENQVKALTENVAELEAYRDRERNWKVEIAELKQAAAESKCHAIQELASTAFRNPRLVHSETWNENRTRTDQYGTDRVVYDNGSRDSTTEESKG